MKLDNIEISRLYGTFDASITFKPDLNIIVGINGSGKTSILNCIDWMLRPDLPRLATAQFKYIRLAFRIESQRYLLTARHDGDLLTVEETLSGKFSNPITVTIVSPPSAIRTENDLERLMRSYKNLGPDPLERPLWKFLHTIEHPLTVTLDRTITAEAGDIMYVESDVRVAHHRKARTPIDKVHEVTRASYAAFQATINSLNDGLKAQLVESAFHDPFQTTRHTRQININDITKLEARVLPALSTSLGLQSAESKIKNYFASAKRFAKTAPPNDDAMRNLFWTQYRYVGELADAFDKYEQLVAKAYAELKSYLETINSFFFDSGKNVGFDKDGSLAFRYLDSNGEPSVTFRSLDKLSSGERQIITLITFLTYLAPNQVFVVDEPELSLHPRWQENFLSAILNQAPNKTQIIIATHSPEIAAGHRENCIVLSAR